MIKPEDYLNELKNSYKSYSHLKLLITPSISKEEFNDIVKDTFTQIYIDEKRYNEYRKDNKVLPVIEKEYGNLVNYSMNLLQYLCYFKNLIDF